MSQTETILLVVLGFSLAALIALFIGRLVWSLGLKLGARRMQKQVPSTVSGLQAERNRLRAEYAMLSQRLNARLDQVRLHTAEQMAEVTRHRNRLELLRDELAAKDVIIAAHEGEILTLRDRIAQLEAEAAAAQVRMDSLRAELDAARLVAPAVSGQPAEAATATDAGLRSRIDQLTRLSQLIAAESGRTPPQPATSAEPSTPALPDAMQHEAADLQKELELLDAEWNRKLAELDDAKTEPADSPDNGKTGAVANVVSLANRIRALKSDIAK